MAAVQARDTQECYPTKPNSMQQTKLFATKPNSLQQNQTLCNKTKLFATKPNSLQQNQTLCNEPNSLQQNQTHFKPGSKEPPLYLFFSSLTDYVILQANSLCLILLKETVALDFRSLFFVNRFCPGKGKNIFDFGSNFGKLFFIWTRGSRFFELLITQI